MACASIELWNERMHCRVNKGAKGIALMDENSEGRGKLRYVFDVSYCGVFFDMYAQVMHIDVISES